MKWVACKRKILIKKKIGTWVDANCWLKQADQLHHFIYIWSESCLIILFTKAGIASISLENSFHAVEKKKEKIAHQQNALILPQMQTFSWYSVILINQQTRFKDLSNPDHVRIFTRAILWASSSITGLIQLECFSIFLLYRWFFCSTTDPSPFLSQLL